MKTTYPSNAVRRWKCTHAVWEPVEDTERELIGYCCYDCGFFEPFGSVTEPDEEEGGFGFFDEPQEIN